MNNHNIKAVFFDIDGTLVSFQSHTVPLSARRAIERLREQGIKVFIATGRLMRHTEVVEDTVPLYNVLCSVKCDIKTSKITLEPEGKEIPFEYENGRVSFTVPKVDIHQMVVIKN